MTRTKVSPLLLCLSILSAACTKELRYTKEELLARTQAADPTATVILPRNMEEGASCMSYTSGCVSAHTVKVRQLELIAVEFMSTTEAIHAAKKYRGFYLRNWFLDDVSGEPSLERFVVEKLEAKKP